MSIKLCIFSITLTATTFFLIGAYFQHYDVVQGIHDLIQNDPYAFHIRHQLYKLLRLFTFDGDALLWKNPSRLVQIMKYGFPGLDDIRLYSDFVLSYDRRNRVAHWVYEHLRTPCVRGSPYVSRRQSSFVPDFSVPSDFRTDTDDYRNSGFDRGHLAAAANHRCEQTHCNETFYLTNIAPQVGKGFNRDAWNNLEIYVRELTERYGSVYVCTGPLYVAKRSPQGKYVVEFEVIGANTVAVPTHFFKVVVIESQLDGGSPYMEAYMMPNTELPSDVDIRTFLCDIRQIERVAGLKFGLRSSRLFGANFMNLNDIFRMFF